MKIKLKELVLKEQHPWNGLAIRDLDISRQTIIVMVRRGNRMLIPTGSLVLESGDVVILYSKKTVADTVAISV